MGKIRVLIVDDHAVMRDGIRALLDTHDDIDIVGEASDGKEAIEKARELAPDVILMDIAMPGMDGLEATRRITATVPHAKVLVLTQWNNREYVLSSVKAGASGYVPKIAPGAELVSAIRAVSQGQSFLHPTAATALMENVRQRNYEAEPYEKLTAREREILKLFAEGRTGREIADLLGITIKTILGYRAKIMEKLGLHNRAELVKYAIRKGLTSTDT